MEGHRSDRPSLPPQYLSEVACPLSSAVTPPLQAAILARREQTSDMWGYTSSRIEPLPGSHASRFDRFQRRPRRARDDAVRGIEERLRDVITLADQHHLGRCRGCRLALSARGFVLKRDHK